MHPCDIALRERAVRAVLEAILVAERCTETGVPFVPATGYGDSGQILESCPAARVLMKSFGRENLVTAIASLEIGGTVRT